MGAVKAFATLPCLSLQICIRGGVSLGPARGPSAAHLAISGPNSRTRIAGRCSSNARAQLCTAAIAEPDQGRGGLPRFHAEEFPPCEGAVVRIGGDEFWHMTRVLRLGVDDLLELFDGRGNVARCRIATLGRREADVTAVERPRAVARAGPSWHVAAAFGTLKGGRGEWLVEKCAELGAAGLTPLVTRRSEVKGTAGRADRWERIAMAAAKQCQRLHGLEIGPPMGVRDFVDRIPSVDAALVAVAGAPPLVTCFQRMAECPRTGILFVGPEGDFTDEEVEELTRAGACPVGLGPRRLRVETAAIALLSGVMLFGDSLSREVPAVA